MAPLDLVVYLSGMLGLALVAGFSFSMYYHHRIPQFLILGFALVPFAVLALFFRTTEDPFYKELGLYAAVVAMLLIIGFAIGVLYPKSLELQYFLPYVLFAQLLGLFAAITRHETSYEFSEIIFVIPLLSAAMVAMGLVTWKFHRLKVPQLTILLFSFFLAIFIAGFLWFFNPLFGYVVAAYLACVVLIILSRANNPETLASLYREYLLLPRAKTIHRLESEELAIGVLVFGPKGPELVLETGNLFDEEEREKINPLQFCHFYFTMIKPLLQDTRSFLELFGPVRPFGLPKKQSLVCATLLASEAMGDPRYGGKTVTIFVLLYPRQKESSEMGNFLRIYLQQYCQDLNSLEELSNEKIQALRQTIIEKLNRDLFRS